MGENGDVASRLRVITSVLGLFWGTIGRLRGEKSDCEGREEEDVMVNGGGTTKAAGGDPVGN